MNTSEKHFMAKIKKNCDVFLNSMEKCYEKTNKATCI